MAQTIYAFLYTMLRLSSNEYGITSENFHYFLW